MIKILYAAANRPLDAQMLEFPTYLARLSQSPLYGLIARELPASEPLVEGLSGRALSRPRMSVVSTDTDRFTRFRELCRSQGVLGKVHPLPVPSIRDLVRETRFADLLLLDPRFSEGPEEDQVPSASAVEIFRQAECPVISVPPKFGSIQEIVFACDGSASSVHALRQVSYLFPQFSDRKITVLHTYEHQMHAPWKDALNEWLQMHFQDVYFQQKQGKLFDVLMEECYPKPNLMLVLGAYGRSSWSQFLRESQAQRILNLFEGPVCIAHPHAR